MQTTLIQLSLTSEPSSPQQDPKLLLEERPGPDLLDRIYVTYMLLTHERQPGSRAGLCGRQTVTPTGCLWEQQVKSRLV